MKRKQVPIAMIGLATVLGIAAVGCTRGSSPRRLTPSPVQTETLTADEPAVCPRPATTATVASAVTIAPGEGQPTLAATATTLSVPADAERAVELARQDLAGRLGLALGEMLFVAAEEVQWPDAGLGCPEEGMLYPQVVTPGFRVLLVAQELVYEYHTDAGQFVVLCQEEPMSKNHTPDGRVETGLEPLADRARQDLAHRLSIPVEQIEVVEAKSVVWPDGGLGCPEPGMAYAQVQVEGVLIRLYAGQRTYSYHGGGGTPPFLCERATTEARPAG